MDLVSSQKSRFATAAVAAAATADGGGNRRRRPSSARHDSNSRTTLIEYAYSSNSFDENNRISGSGSAAAGHLTNGKSVDKIRPHSYHGICLDTIITPREQEDNDDDDDDSDRRCSNKRNNKGGRVAMKNMGKLVVGVAGVKSFTRGILSKWFASSNCTGKKSTCSYRVLSSNCGNNRRGRNSRFAVTNEFATDEDGFADISRTWKFHSSKRRYSEFQSSSSSHPLHPICHI